MTKKLAKSHWDNFSEDTGVLAQLGGSTCPQMSSDELSQPFILVLLLWLRCCGVSNQHLGFYIDLLVDCEMKIKMRRKLEEKLHQRVVFHFHTIASSEALVFILVYYM